jgi:hypothetical protein
MKKFSLQFNVPVIEKSDVRNLANKAGAVAGQVASAAKAAPKAAVTGLEKAGDHVYNGLAAAQLTLEAKKRQLTLKKVNQKQLKAKFEDLRVFRIRVLRYELEMQDNQEAKDAATVLGRHLDSQLWELQCELK